MSANGRGNSTGQNIRRVARVATVRLLDAGRSVQRAVTRRGHGTSPTGAVHGQAPQVPDGAARELQTHLDSVARDVADRVTRQDQGAFWLALAEDFMRRAGHSDNADQIAAIGGRVARDWTWAQDLVQVFHRHPSSALQNMNSSPEARSWTGLYTLARAYRELGAEGMGTAQAELNRIKTIAGRIWGNNAWMVANGEEPDPE